MAMKEYLFESIEEESVVEKLVFFVKREVRIAELFREQ
jgi:hypothetical protein